MWIKKKKKKNLHKKVLKRDETKIIMLF